MKVLFVSNLFPNANEPTRGMHNAQQVAALEKLCSVRVVAPTHAAMPDEPNVLHPRFRHVPLLSRPLNGWLFARAITPALHQEEFDVVLVNWAYPDSYGVMLVAEKMNFPFAVTVQGSDVNVFFENPTRKRQILRALRASRTVFCRSEALREKLLGEGIEATTVYNGIDRDKFYPRDRSECCRQLGLDPNRRRVLYVGNLLPVKGPTVLAEAARHLNGVDVIFIGTGTEKITAGKCVGARPHDEIPVWINASDLLCLPSFNEGLPNVVLEAMACGVPAVASRVGGVPEILRDGVNGLLVPAGNVGALATALERALEMNWDRKAICASVAKFDWNVNAQTVLEALQRTMQK